MESTKLALDAWYLGSATTYTVYYEYCSVKPLLNVALNVTSNTLFEELYATALSNIFFELILISFGAGLTFRMRTLASFTPRS